MDQPTGNPQDIFDAIVADMEVRKAARDFDNVDHSGQNIPDAVQVAAAADVMAKARELRRILQS
jgi:hypothetical protein